MSAKSRTKGKRGELEVVALARRLGFARACRSAPMQAGQSQEWPDVAGLAPLWLEVKCTGTQPGRALEDLLKLLRELRDARGRERDVWDGPEPLPAGKDLGAGPA